MFSKFLQCQDKDALAAVKMQFQMEFAKATRKFKKNIQKTGKKTGRPALGQLQFAKLQKQSENQGKVLDFTEIARKVATTRFGQRLHSKVTKGIAEEGKTRKAVRVYLLFIFLLVIN